MRTWSLIVALMIALSGCFGSDEPADDHMDDHDDNMDGMDGNATANGSPPRLAFFADNNTLPVDEPAVFNINVTDDDEDFLDFTLDVDGDGETDTTGSLAPLDGVYAPFNFTYSYTAVGLYNATLNLTDGTHTLERVIVMNVTSDEAVSNLPPIEPISETHDVQLPCPQCLFVSRDSSISWRTGTPGVDAVWIEIPVEAAGHPFTVESTGGDPDVHFLVACEGGAEALATHEEVGMESGDVPAGAGCMLSWEFADAASSITFTVT